MLRQGSAFTAASRLERVMQKFLARQDGSDVAEKEKPLPSLKLPASRGEVCLAFQRVGHSENAEAVQAKPGAVDALRPSRFVGEHFTEEGSLVKILPNDGHGAAVGFKEEPSPVSAFWQVGVFQTKYRIGNNTDAVPGAHIDVPMEWLAGFLRCGWQGDILTSEETNARCLPARQFQRDHDVRYHERVLQKESACALILAAPVHAGEGHVQIAPQASGSATAEPINHFLRAAAMVVINLRRGPLKVTVMVEQLQPSQDLLDAAANECGKLRGSQKPVRRDTAQDFQIPRGHLHGL